MKTYTITAAPEIGKHLTRDDIDAADAIGLPGLLEEAETLGGCTLFAWHGLTADAVPAAVAHLRERHGLDVFDLSEENDDDGHAIKTERIRTSVDITEHSSPAEAVNICGTASAYTLQTIPGEELERLHTATVYSLRGSGRIPSDALADPAELFGAAYIEAARMETETAEPLPLAVLWYRATYEAARTAYRAERAATSRPAGRDEDGRPERAAHVRLDAMEPEAVGALLSDEYSDTPERVYIRRETVAEALAAVCQDDGSARLVQMIAAGWTLSEIGAAWSISPQAVAQRLDRLHRRAERLPYVRDALNDADAAAAAEALADFGARARLAQAWDALHRLAAD